jgi:RimJ/RimL family protein N-acetyltransferase
VFGLLEGKNVNLRIAEKEDLPLFQEWLNNPEFQGEFQPPLQWSRAELEKFESSPLEPKNFIIEKKDGKKIGYMLQYNSYLGLGKLLEIGYALLPSERGKGYCTEAAQLMVDYLFLSIDVSRIQATTSIKNKGSQKVLEKAGFTREGTIRKTARGERRDAYLYSILREEWKEPKILTKTTSQSKHK